MAHPPGDQCGKPSVPCDVVVNLSNNLKIWNSSIGFQDSLGAACLFLGWFDTVNVFEIVRVKQVGIDARTVPMCRLLGFTSDSIDALSQFFCALQCFENLMAFWE